jgi:hypothetical protein
LTNCSAMWSSSASRSNRCDTPGTVPTLPAQARSERYSALMGHTKHIHLLLASVLVTSVAFAQTTDTQTPDSAPAEGAVVAARSQYTPTAPISTDASDGKTLAQFTQRRLGAPFPRQHGYPRGGYQTPWMHHASPGHVLIGAAIGFGVGAALGAHQSAHNGTPVSGGIIIGGGLFGLIGGCIGQAVGEFSGMHYSSTHRRRGYQPSWPDDDQDSDLRSPSKAEEDTPGASAKSASASQPAVVETTAGPSPAMPAVP